jgi:hypothetical protein
MSHIPMDINSNKVQGLIAAIVRAADSGYLSAIRLELKNHEGLVDILTTDSSMMRSHCEPNPLSEKEAAEIIADVNLHFACMETEVLH